MESIKSKAGIKYREKIYIEGREFKSPLFIRKTDAKSWKAKMLRDRDRGKVSNKFNPKLTLENYAKTFLQRVKEQRARKTFLDYESRYRKHLAPLFKSRYLSDIDSSCGHLLVSKLQKESKSIKGINLNVALLKRILNSALEDEIISVNRLSSFKLLKESPRPDSYLTELEIRQLLSANMHDPLVDLYTVAVYTGMRRGELAGLKWDRVNFERGFIEVTRTRDREGLKETTKSHEKRFVPINQICKRVLEKLIRKQANLEYVFIGRQGNPIAVNHIYREFKAAQVKAGFQNFYRFHDLRHTFASHFMMKGGNIYDLQKILGHSNITMTQKYAHLSPSHLSRATEILNFSEITRPNIGHKIKNEVENVTIINR